MHLIFYIRGIYNRVELFKSLAQGQFFKWRRINKKTKKEETVLVQGAFRPSVLGAWEYIFPEEALIEVLSVFGITEDIGAEPTFINKAKLAVIRKLFGAEKITKEMLNKAKKTPSSIQLGNSERGLSGLRVHGVAIHPIGLKRDDRRELYDPAVDETFIQEML